MRFWLSIWGLIWTSGGTAAFALAGRPGWAVLCAAIWLIAAIDLVIIVHHIHQGPHYQPGPGVPPYQPPSRR
jgi:hypothetical protein